MISTCGCGAPLDDSGRCEACGARGRALKRLPPDSVPLGLFGPSSVPAAWPRDINDLTACHTRFDAEQIRSIPPKQRWLLQHAIPRGKVAVFAAEGGLGKSALLTGLAVARAAGLPSFLGRAVEAGSTLVLGAEDGPSEFLRSIAAWRAVLPESIDLDLVRQRLGFLHVGGKGVRLVRMRFGQHEIDPFVEVLKDWLAFRGQAPDHIIVETASRFGSGEDNEGSARLIDACEAIVEATRAAVTLVHHVGKSASGRRLDAYASRGGSALADNSRASMLLYRLDEGIEHVALKVTKVSAGPADQPPMVLRRVVVEGLGIAFELRGREAEAEVEIRKVVDEEAERVARARRGACIRDFVRELRSRPEPVLAKKTNLRDEYAPDLRRALEAVDGGPVSRDRLRDSVAEAIADRWLNETQKGAGRGGGKVLVAGFGPGLAAGESAEPGGVIQPGGEERPPIQSAGLFSLKPPTSSAGFAEGTGRKSAEPGGESTEGVPAEFGTAPAAPGDGTYEPATLTLVAGTTTPEETP